MSTEPLATASKISSVQLMIYVGGTMVLLIFGVMLTAKGPFVTMKTGAQDWVVAAFVGGALLYVLVNAAMKIDQWSGGLANDQTQHRPSATRIGMALIGARVDKLEQKDATLREGMSGYLLPFEIISVHLLVVLIGAAYLARTRRSEKLITHQSLGDEQ